MGKREIYYKEKNRGTENTLSVYRNSIYHPIILMNYYEKSAYLHKAYNLLLLSEFCLVQMLYR